MPLRYQLRAITPQDDADDFLEEITDHKKAAAAALAGEIYSGPWNEVFEHLRSLGAKTLLIQKKVIDPDFVEEHQAFYAKQHRPVSRKCTRVHAFALECPAELAGAERPAEEARILGFLDLAAQSESSYLGFATIRPLRHAPVGATILRPLPGRVPTLIDEFPVHIAGNRFCVTGTPFLQQDSAVGACAQASIWMALRAVRRRHGNAAYSPAELTTAATRYLTVDRPYPGEKGLTIGQMLDAIRFAGHDPLHLSLREPDSEEKCSWTDVIRTAGPYLDSGVPVLIVLSDHVVVGIGPISMQTPVAEVTAFEAKKGGLEFRYMPVSNWMRGSLVHNDHEGPYGQLIPRQADESADYALEDTCSLVIPLPDGIFTTAAEAVPLAVQAFWRAFSFVFAAVSETPKVPEVRIALRPILCTRHAFRKWALEDPDLDAAIKTRYRTYEVPPHVWVVELHDASKYDPDKPSVKSRCGEVVLDASASPLHADSHIFTAVSSALWPSRQDLVAGVFLCETDETNPSALQVGAATTGKVGARIAQPWAS
jgi:hypothetical protein